MSKVKISDDGTTLQVKIGGFQMANLPVVLFLLVWLGGWAMGETFAIMTLFGGDTPWFVNSFLLIWLIGWTVGGAFAILSVIKLIGGSETIELGRGLLKISRSFVVLKRQKQYDVFRISDLHIDPKKQNRLHPFNNGAFRFTYEEKDVRFGAGLTKPHKDEIWRLIREHRDTSDRNFRH